MSLLIKALKQAERRHQEALQQVTAEAAAVEAALPATAGPGVGPAGTDASMSAASERPSALASGLGNGAALDGPASVVAETADAGGATQAFASEGLSLEPQHPADPIAAASEAAHHASPVGQDSGTGADGGTPVATPDGASRTGILGLLPARMEAPAIDPAAVGAAAAGTGAPMPADPVAALTDAASDPSSAALRPASGAPPVARAAGGLSAGRRVVLLGLLASACGAGGWLALDWLAVPARPAPPLLQGAASLPMLPPLGEVALPPPAGTEAGVPPAPTTADPVADPRSVPGRCPGRCPAARGCPADGRCPGCVDGRASDRPACGRTAARSGEPDRAEPASTRRIARRRSGATGHGPGSRCATRGGGAGGTA